MCRAVKRRAGAAGAQIATLARSALPARSERGGHPGPLGTTQDTPERPGRRLNPRAPSATGEAALPMRPGHSNKAGALPWAPRDRGGCGARRGREQGGDRGPSAVGAVGPGGGSTAASGEPVRREDPGLPGLWAPDLGPLGGSRSH